MKSRSVWFVRVCPGSARVPRAGFGVAPKQSFLRTWTAGSDMVQEKFATVGHRRPPARRVRYPIRFAALLVFAPVVCFAQDAVRSTSTDQEETVEAEPVVVSATRFGIPLDQSPATVSVITSEDIEQKQIERVSDALREVPGLSVVETGTAGQLTSVFMRGLPSQDMQVLLNGIPINQGLAGQFDFANLMTDDIDRIEVVRGPQSTLYGPRALAGIIQIFTKRGEGQPGISLSAEGGSYDTFREWSH